MLSGIMFPIDLLPDFLETIGRIFPASWGYGNPINAPIETLITIIDCISVLLISGITEVKIPPISRKKILFEAALPVQLPFFFLALAIYIIVSLSIGSILGLVVKNQAKLTMIAQLVFLPSIMLRIIVRVLLSQIGKYIRSVPFKLLPSNLFGFLFIQKYCTYVRIRGVPGLR